MPPSDPLASTADPVHLAELGGCKLIVYPKEARPSFADQVMTLVDGAGVGFAR